MAVITVMVLRDDRSCPECNDFDLVGFTDMPLVSLDQVCCLCSEWGIVSEGIYIRVNIMAWQRSWSTKKVTPT